MAGDADDVANIESLKKCIRVVAQAVFARVNLQLTAAVLNLKKSGFPHPSKGHDPSRDTDIALVLVQILVADIGCRRDRRLDRMGRPEVVGIDDITGVAQLGELLPPHFDLLATIVENTMIVISHYFLIRIRKNGRHYPCIEIGRESEAK